MCFSYIKLQVYKTRGVLSLNFIIIYNLVLFQRGRAGLRLGRHTVDDSVIPVGEIIRSILLAKYPSMQKHQIQQLAEC